MPSISALKSGLKIIFQSQPFEVVKYDHLKMGRGGAIVRTKLRNLLTGAVIENSFNSSEHFEEADVSYCGGQFLYAEGNLGFFMLNDTYEQVEVKLTDDILSFLKEGQNVDLVKWEDKVISVKLPNKIELKVDYTEPGFKGDTASATTKPAKLETGATINVPLFINNGDLIRINTETKSYVERI